MSCKTDRDRLIELLKKADSATWGQTYESYADYLLANGIIVPPFQIGQKVYDISELMSGTYAPEMYVFQDNELHIEKSKTGEYIYTYDGMYINNEDIGETVFLTKEEAEEKLKEREG